MLQQLPQRLCVPLDTIRSTDHQHRIIQYLQCPLHLCGKVHMSRRIQKGDLRISPDHPCLFGKNRDTPLPLMNICIQKGILMIYPAGFSYRTAGIEHRL